MYVYMAKTGNSDTKKNESDNRSTFPHNLYKINTYAEASGDFIKKNTIGFYLIDDVVKQLNTDNGYHFRIHKNTQYTFFGDLDNFSDSIEFFFSLLQIFLKIHYNIFVDKSDFKYTKNNNKKGSYHYSIPKWNASTEKLKEIHQNFINKYGLFLTYKIKSMTKSCVDTSIFSEHWFRCPNQKKGTSSNDNSKHEIIVGNMADFIVTNIQKNSVNINKVNFIDLEIKSQDDVKSHIAKSENKKQKKIFTNEVEICLPNLGQQKNNETNTPKVQKVQKTIKVPKVQKIQILSDKDNDDESSLNKKTNAIVEYNNKCTAVTTYNQNQKNDITLTKTMSEPTLYKKMFDECYSQIRFEQYDYWISVGMALKNTFKDEEIAFELFDYYSAKGRNYVSTDETKKKYVTFIKKKIDDKYTVSTIYYYAITDNKPKCIEIMNKNTFDLEQYDVCKYAKLMAGDRYVYSCTDNVTYKLCCYNGKKRIKIFSSEFHFKHQIFNTTKNNLKGSKYFFYPFVSKNN